MKCLTSVDNAEYEDTRHSHREKMFLAEGHVKEAPCPEAGAVAVRDVQGGDNAACVVREGEMSTCCSWGKGLLGQPLHPQP